MTECPAGVFVRTLPRLLVHSHHDFHSGNTHPQLLHTGLFTLAVHKHWDQVTTGRGLMKSEVSHFSTSTGIRKRAKTAK